MQKNRQKSTELPTWKPGFQVTWRWHRQVGEGIEKHLRLFVDFRLGIFTVLGLFVFGKKI